MSVLEADEYDRSFLNLSPDWAIITSIDADHLDIYGTEAIEQGFRDFADLVPENDQLFVRKGVNIGRPCNETYAVNEEADYYLIICDCDSWMMFDFHAGEQS